MKITKQELANIIKEEVEKALSKQKNQPSKEDVAMALIGYFYNTEIEKRKKGQGVDFDSIENWTSNFEELSKYAKSGSFSSNIDDGRAEYLKKVLNIMSKMPKKDPNYFKELVKVGRGTRNSTNYYGMEDPRAKK